MVDDAELLRRYSKDGSHAAFAEFVRRHLSLVYFSALRRTSGNTHAALDVTQDVFIAAARRAASLSRYTVVTGWLYTATRNGAINTMIAAKRRQAREQEASIMQELSSPGSSPPDWTRMKPLLHNAIDELGHQDRAAILLRFYDDLPYSKIGAELRLTEEAARKRVDRALEKMNAFLTQRGIASTTAALTAGLAGEAVMAAPTGVLTTVTGAALAGASGGGGGIGLLQILLAMNKIKVGIMSAITVVGAATLIFEAGTHWVLNNEIKTEQTEVRRLPTRLAPPKSKNSEINELARLLNRIAILKARPDGVVDSEMKPASTWRDVGRSTPEAAWETLSQACYSRDLNKAASFIVFSDDSPENRNAFMASFSDIVRAKYQAPERLVAAALFDIGTDRASSPTFPPDTAYQFLGLQTTHLGDGRAGQVRVNVWFSQASGNEWQGGSRFQPAADGWALGALSFSPDAKPSENALTLVQSRIDPANGNLLPAAR